MAGINQTIASNRESLRDYSRRQKALKLFFKTMGRGSQARAAFDLKMSPATVSDIVRGSRMSLATLMLIEEWVKAQATPPARKRVRKAAEKEVVA